jgi:hypothetical protein
MHVPINRRIYGETAMIKNIPSQMTRVLVLTVGVLTAGVVAGGAQAVALTPVAVEASAGAGPRPGCIGDSFEGTLEASKAICSEKYLVRMQDNGDLVLREISTGRACWASRTRAPGDAVARFIKPEFPDPGPLLSIDSTSQGTLAVFDGDFDLISNVIDPKELNASVNNKGEFWVGFKKIANC